MTKFHRLQKLSSIIPVLSSVFIFFVTMFELKRSKASVKSWVCFFSTFFITGIGAYILNAVVMTGEHPLLSIVATGLLLAIANIICVDLQVQCANESYHDAQNKKTVANKRIYIACGIVLALFVVSLVVAGVMFAILSDLHVTIDDTNGSKTNLAVITREDILSTDNHYSAYGTHSSYQGSQTSVQGKLDEHDFEKVTFGSKKTSGIRTLQTTQTASNQVTLIIESELQAGNMEIYIIIEGEFYDCVQANESKTIQLQDVSNKLIVIKMAAESADVELTVTRKVD